MAAAVLKVQRVYVKGCRRIGGEGRGFCAWLCMYGRLAKEESWLCRFDHFVLNGVLLLRFLFGIICMIEMFGKLFWYNQTLKIRYVEW